MNLNPMNHFFRKHKEKFLKHKEKLIWLHSIYALVIGIGVMWLGSKDFRFIRLAIVEITFIWLSSLAIPLVLSHKKLSQKWKERIRLLINYFNRNFYQQLLFFVLPIYYMSTTIDSQNIIFIVLVAVSAILSTMDIIYDRFISVKAMIMSLFFAFNLFAAINVMMPIIWGVRVVHAIRISAILAFIGFATFCFKLSDVSITRKKIIIGFAAAMFFFISEFGRPYIPPAPLRLDKIEFGAGITKGKLKLTKAYTNLPTGTNRVYAIAYIKAPLKLKEIVKICVYLNGELYSYSRSNHQIMGKGEKGWFRLWTYSTLKKIPPGSTLTVAVENEGGQLIGRGSLKTLNE